MRYIEGMQRTQTELFPETLDSYISEDNVIRFIDEYVNTLDLKALGFTYSETKATGRKPYNPSTLIKLYIYGYMKKIRSSRHLEAETQRNIELMWLLNKLKPDFKTIADFRRDNVKPLKKIHKEFIILCKKLDLFSKELVAIDGSKFRAFNNDDQNYTKSKLSRMVKEIDKQIEEYLRNIEKQDSCEQSLKKYTSEELKELLKNLDKEKTEVNNMLKALDEGAQDQISRTDPDSRMMSGRDGTHVSYNVQIAVETKNHFITDFEVINDRNDERSLSMMSFKAKETLEADELKVVADGGYFNKKEIAQCVDHQIECYIPRPHKSFSDESGKYKLDKFIFDSEADRYICPQGKPLTYRGTYLKSGLMQKKYECCECKFCQAKKQCTEAKRNRAIMRWVREEIVDEMDNRLRANKQMMVIRKSTVEHVFGTIKHWMGFRHFLLKGFEKVKAEMSLAVLCYNIKRAVNILGVKGLIAALPS